MNAKAMVRARKEASRQRLLADLLGQTDLERAIERNYMIVSRVHQQQVKIEYDKIQEQNKGQGR